MTAKEQKLISSVETLKINNVSCKEFNDLLDKCREFFDGKTMDVVAITTLNILSMIILEIEDSYFSDIFIDDIIENLQIMKLQKKGTLQ